MRPYEALREAVALLAQAGTPEFSAKLAESLPKLQEVAEGKLPRAVIKGGKLCCPFCGGEELEEHEDILSCRDVQGVHKGVIYVDSYDSRNDGGDNMRLVCQNGSCDAWLDYPEGVDIEYENLPDEKELCECGREWEACATREGAENHGDR